MTINAQLPSLPQPWPPQDPPCAWCGERPATAYEVEPAIEGWNKQQMADGRIVQAKVVKKKAVIAYVCEHHHVVRRLPCERRGGGVTLPDLPPRAQQVVDEVMAHIQRKPLERLILEIEEAARKLEYTPYFPPPNADTLRRWAETLRAASDVR